MGILPSETTFKTLHQNWYVIDRKNVLFYNSNLKFMEKRVENVYQVWSTRQ
jgi:hypothetical protein